MEIKTTEFFKNMKTLPPEGTEEFQQLIDWEIEKCLGGVTVGGVFISGWLYWHTNHWNIALDDEDDFGNVVSPPGLADLRDNEWERAEHLENCRREKQGYIEVGGRQLGKSVQEASFSTYNSILFENSQNIIIGNNSNDLDMLKSKIDFGLKHLWKGISIPRLDKTWRGNQVRLGYKETNGEDVIWSTILIRNTDGGKNTEVAAGTTAKSFVMDEIGKSDFSKAYEAVKPAFRSKFGFRAIPMLVGTGGAFEKGEDAERIFYNPEANEFLGVVNPHTGKTTGLFMSGVYRQDCKYKTNLADYLRKEKGRSIEEGSELEKIEIWVADKEKAVKLIHEERENKKKDPDQSEYLKLIMYNPLTPEECFMRKSNSIFSIVAAKTQQQRIYNNDIKASNVFLFHDGEKIGFEYTKQLPISKFPHSHSEDLDAPIQIWEFPVIKPEFGQYIIGIDPYSQADSKYSKSLGAAYVFKRVADILETNKYQYRFVASYVARPETLDKFHEQVRLLIKWYNALAFCENDVLLFIEYMKAKGDAHYLQPQPDWVKSEIHASSKVNKDYGIHSTPQIIAHRDGHLKKYLEEIVHVEKDENGSITKELSGVAYVLDPMLLEEIIKHDPSDKDWNGDRIVAAGLAITLSNHMGPLLGNSATPDTKFDSYYDRENKPKSSIIPHSSRSRLSGSMKQAKRILGKR